MDFASAAVSVERASAMYLALRAYLAAYEVREPIADRLHAVGPEFIIPADDIFFDALNRYRRGDFAGALSGAERALPMYHALRAGIAAYDVREGIDVD